jgi:hypothetical protein
MPERVCIFCRKELLDRSKEHIIPQWIIEERGLAGIRFRRVVSDFSGNRIDERSEQTIGSLLEGRVCARCNKGWMSSLEVKVKPILSTLWSEPLEVINLSSKDRRLLATWVTKTAYVINRSSNYHQLVSNKHCCDLYKTQTPPHSVRVFVGCSPFETEIDIYETRSWNSSTRRGTAPEVLTDRCQYSYKIGFQIGYLALMCAYYDHVDSGVCSLKDFHRSIWGRCVAQTVIESWPDEPNSSQEWLASWVHTLEAIDRHYDGGRIESFVHFSSRTPINRRPPEEPKL